MMMMCVGRWLHASVDLRCPYSASAIASGRYHNTTIYGVAAVCRMDILLHDMPSQVPTLEALDGQQELMVMSSEAKLAVTEEVSSCGPRSHHVEVRIATARWSPFVRDARSRHKPPSHHHLETVMGVIALLAALGITVKQAVCNHVGAMRMMVAMVPFAGTRTPVPMAWADAGIVVAAMPGVGGAAIQCRHPCGDDWSDALAPRFPATCHRFISSLIPLILPLGFPAARKENVRCVIVGRFRVPLRTSVRRGRYARRRLTILIHLPISLWSTPGVPRATVPARIFPPPGAPPPPSAPGPPLC